MGITSFIKIFLPLFLNEIAIIQENINKKFDNTYTA